MKILILEDDIKMASELKLFLDRKGFECSLVHTGKDLFNFDLDQFNIYLLDINVPLLNGIEVCRKIRETNRSCLILMLTAYGTVNHKVEAFDYGADDYLVKPFHLDELLARIKALLRRTNLRSADVAELIYEVEDLKLNTSSLRVTRGDKELMLTPKEYRLLELLAMANGEIVSKQIISEKVWGINFDTGTNTIEVYINFLRSKVDKEHQVKLIHTRPGYGYYLKKL